MSGAPALQVEGLTLRFGGVTALDDVSFAVREGGLSALIGPNGAGKTSMFNCLSGIYRPAAGTVRLAGRDVTGMRPFRIARSGLARTFQTPTLFDGLTVVQNVLTGRYRHGRGGLVAGMLRLPHVIDDEVRQREHVEEILELLDIARYRHSDVAELSYGLRKRVELGRALAQRPSVLLLDEPMAGMSAEEKHDMSTFIRTGQAETGCTVVLIEHDMTVVMDLAEHVVVLDFGCKIGDGTPAEVRADEAVIAAYLGAETGPAEVAP